MQRTQSIAIVWVTAPDLVVARAIARAALQSRHAACVNLIPAVESHYWWQGKIESGAEVLMIFKTPRSTLAKLKRTVLAKHPYDTPEFVVVAVSGGSEKYLSWVRQSVSARRPANHRRPRAARKNK